MAPVSQTDLLRQHVTRELQQFYFGWAPTMLWLRLGPEFSAPALAATRHALLSGNFQFVDEQPAGNSLTDNLHLVFFESPQQQLMAALVWDPFALWADLRVLELRPAAALPASAALLQ